MLTLAEVEALVAKESGDVSVKWFDGTEWHTSKTPTGSASGSYTGKAGTMRRSNKGRSHRGANGKRNYLIDYDTKVVAYKL